MRAEDLFEAMGGIDEEQIARSERRVRSSQKKSSSETTNGTAGRKNRKRKSKRSMGAEIYRFTVVAMSTAVIVFVLLMAKDFLGIRSLSDLKSAPVLGSAADTAQESLDSSGIAANETEDSAAGEAESADTEEASESTVQSEADTAAEAPVLNAEPAGEEAAAEEELEKTAVDLLGEFKGDYIKLEYISAEDEANGGSRIVPEYSEEGEAALSEAFSKGKATPKIIAETGEATYYVYLTKENGEVHKVTFYENCYVGMDNVPGVVMKITQAEYEDVMELFR